MVSKIGGDVMVNLKITSCSNVCFLKQNGIKQKMAQVQTQEKTLLKRLISSGSISAVNGSTGMKVGVGMAWAICFHIAEHQGDLQKLRAPAAEEQARAVLSLLLLSGWVLRQGLRPMLCANSAGERHTWAGAQAPVCP